MLEVMSLDGNSVTNCPMEDLRMQWALASDMEAIIVQHVSVEKRLSIVRTTDRIITNPIQYGS